MNGLIYLIGLVVVVLAILSFLGGKIIQRHRQCDGKRLLTLCDLGLGATPPQAVFPTRLSSGFSLIAALLSLTGAASSFSRARSFA